PLAKRFNLCPLSIGQNKAIHKQRESQLPRPGESFKSQQTLNKKKQKTFSKWGLRGETSTAQHGYYGAIGLSWTRHAQPGCFSPLEA
ncbi:MAG TPA: hypothetical protein VL356_05315, partial [Acidocella sp.]|nr:hypothetical protein [Acidocella sp.]